MPQYLSIGELFCQLVHQFGHCLSLFFGAVVLRLALGINAADVADMNAIVIVPLHPVAGFRDRPVLNYLAIPFNDEMVTRRTPVQHLFMVSVNAVCRGRYVAGGGVQNDVVNWSHLQMGLVEQRQIR